MKLSPIALAVAAALSSVQVNGQQSTSENDKLETIEITATKSTQNIQETPLAVQAMSSQVLAENNIGNFDDFAQFLPGVTSGGRGPGQSDIFIRGLAIQPITVLLSAAQGTMPNVAMYLDEQPVTAPGRNLDVYAVDLERIEVLPGPQGTLFGASSQAGTIRYITNKPRFDGFDAGFSAILANTHKGEESHNFEGFINFAITDEIALRLAAFQVNRGGYIDNVPGTFTLDPAINPEASIPAGLASHYDVATNEDLVEEDFNDGGYQGFRLGVNFLLSDDWSLLVQFNQQRLEADGVFDYDPTLDDLEVSRFFPDKLEDKFQQGNITLEGEPGNASVVYAGAWLDREVEQLVDYTGYNNAGSFIAYYTCSYDNPAYVLDFGISPEVITDTRECLNPTKGFIGQQQHKRQTHELRISTPLSNRWRTTAGLFYDHIKIKTQDDYIYVAASQLGFAANAPVSTAVSVNPATRPENVTFFNDITRTESQIALFGELYFDITEEITATFGLRWYDLESDLAGSSNFADGIFQGSVNTDRGRDYDRSGGHTTEPLRMTDTIPKFTLSYQPQKQLLWYGTWSQGFRPGGFNRGGGISSVNPEFPDVDVTYNTDDVVNMELGWKSLLFDDTFRFNGNLYFIQWNDMQVSRFDPQNVSILTFIENAADSEIKGLETDFSWLITPDLLLDGAISFNKTKLTNIKGRAIEVAPIGSELPLTPKLQSSLRLKYNWEWQNLPLNWQVSWQYSGKSYSSLVLAERQEQDSFHILNAAFGGEWQNWQAKFYVDNLTDERAQLFLNDQDDILRVTTNRPRTFGIKINWRY